MVKCKNCGQRIIKINYALGEQWMHQPVGASGIDGVHQYCQLTVAEPEEEKPPTIVHVIKENSLDLSDQALIKIMEEGCPECHMPWRWSMGVPFCPRCLKSPEPAVRKEVE